MDTYYAENGTVWAHPTETPQGDGRVSMSLGFPVCTMHEIVGPEAAERVAALMNAGEIALASQD